MVGNPGLMITEEFDALYAKLAGRQTQVSSLMAIIAIQAAPATQCPFEKVPSSMLTIPAIGSPGEFGTKVTMIPLPAITYSSGPTEIIKPPKRGHEPVWCDPPDHAQV